MNETKRKRIVALTTVDNPFDPIDDFRQWYRFDCVDLGYYSSQYLARKLDDLTSKLKREPNEEQMDKLKEAAIDEIIDEDFLNIYRKKVYLKG